jgi:hypothetical protein
MQTKNSSIVRKHHHQISMLSSFSQHDFSSIAELSIENSRMHTIE